MKKLIISIPEEALNTIIEQLFLSGYDSECVKVEEVCFKDDRTLNVLIGADKLESKAITFPEMNVIEFGEALCEALCEDSFDIERKSTPTVKILHVREDGVGEYYEPLENYIDNENVIKKIEIED